MSSNTCIKLRNVVFDLDAISKELDSFLKTDLSFISYMECQRCIKVQKTGIAGQLG